MSVLDVTTAKFSGSRRGYDRSEVDQFMSRIADALQREREELRWALRKVGELEGHLERARTQAALGPEAMAQASDLKQKLLEDATERAVQILRAGYATTLEDEIERLIDAERVELLAIWDVAEDGSPLLDLPSRETRYHRQSAHLPSLGDDTAKVLDDVADLRSKALRNK